MDRITDTLYFHEFNLTAKLGVFKIRQHNSGETNPIHWPDLHVQIPRPEDDPYKAVTRTPGRDGFVSVVDLCYAVKHTAAMYQQEINRRIGEQNGSQRAQTSGTGGTRA